MFKKVNDLVLLLAIVVTMLLFVWANQIWRDNPNNITALIRWLSVFPFTGTIAIWFLRKNFVEYKLVLLCVIAMSIGMTLNTIAIVSNDGKMPIDPALDAAGFPKYYVNGGNMLWLGDSLWMGNSIGDCFSYLAMVVLIYLLIRFAILGIKERMNK